MLELSEKILQEWNCRYGGEVDLRLQFHLTGRGDAYDVRLTKGFDNPFAIRAALHSILFAMPFDCETRADDDQVPLYECSITGSAQMPKIEVNNLEFRAFEKQTALEALAKVPKRKRYCASMFAGSKMKRLSNLFLELYRFPDVPEIVDEISSLVRLMALDCNNPHDWVSMSRALRPRLRIVRHPEETTELVARAAIAPLMHAYRMDRNKTILFELEDAVARHIAIQVLSASKADPVMLASAAILVRETKEAIRHLEYAIREGTNLAKNVLEHLIAGKDPKDMETNQTLNSISFSEGKKPDRSQEGWRKIRTWLPTDTELFMVGSPSTVPVSKRNPDDIHFGSLIVRNEDPISILETDQLRTNRLFENQKISFAIHAARVFDFPGGRSGGTSQSADILVLGEESVNIACAVFEDCRSRAVSREIFEGIEVLTFTKSPFTFAIMRGERLQYLCNPCDGVLISSHHFGFLREIIMRMKDTNTELALPDELEEWKVVDTNADIWLVRHYDRSYVPFDPPGMYDIYCALRDSNSRRNRDLDGDTEESVPTGMESNKEIGFVFSKIGAKWSIKHLSRNQKTLHGLLRSWDNAMNYDYSEGGPSDQQRAKTGFNSEISQTMLSIDATPMEGHEYVQLVLSMGYFVAI